MSDLLTPRLTAKEFSTKWTETMLAIWELVESCERIFSVPDNKRLAVIYRWQQEDVDKAPRLRAALIDLATMTDAEMSNDTPLEAMRAYVARAEELAAWYAGTADLPESDLAQKTVDGYRGRGAWINGPRFLASTKKTGWSLRKVDSWPEPSSVAGLIQSAIDSPQALMSLIRVRRSLPDVPDTKEQQQMVIDIDNAIHGARGRD